MKSIMRIYNCKTKALVKQISGQENPKSLFRDWLYKQKTDDQTIESLLIDSSKELVSFFHIVSDIETEMRCGKVEIILKNKKPHIIEHSTNLLFEYSCTCCSDIQSIARFMVIPEFNEKHYQYYFIDTSKIITPVSILNKLEFLFLENNYWQKLLFKEMKSINSKRKIGLN